MKYTSDEFERFWSKVDTQAYSPADGCWPWKGALSSAGYGSFKLRGSAVTASRLSLCMLTRENPVDKVCRHSCDNPACVRPSHLSWGSVSQNAKDMMDRGRGKGQFAIADLPVVFA